jgi:hypothetical protein
LNKKTFTMEESLESIQRMMTIQQPEKSRHTLAITGVSSLLSVLYVIVTMAIANY